jgi:hypothetical protein
MQRSYKLALLQVYESARDFAGVPMDYPWTGDAEDAKAKYAARLQAALEKYLARFEALITANTASDTWTVQATPTFGDYAVCDACAILCCCDIAAL